jgi:hypothetical protein
MRPPLPPRPFARRLLDSSASRVVALWVVLLVMFLGLWQFFQAGVTGGSAAQEIGREAASPWRNFAIANAPFYLLLAFFGLMVWRIRRFNAENKRGAELMAAGSVAPAAEVFRRLSRARLAPKGIARLNLGMALLRLGDLAGSLEAFAGAERSRLRLYRPLSASFLALAHAMRGDLDAADAWVAESVRRAASPSCVTRIHLAAEAIVRLRRGGAADAVRLLDERWGEIERSTTADLVRAFRIVRALAAATAGSPAQVPDLLAGARPFRPGEYAWMGAGWPEMARYLAANGFAQAA